MADHITHDDLKKFAAAAADATKRAILAERATYAADLQLLRERLSRANELINALVSQHKTRAAQIDTLLARVATLERAAAQPQKRAA